MNINFFFLVHLPVFYNQRGFCFFFYLMILVVISVLGGRWSQRTLWLLQKYFVDF